MLHGGRDGTFKVQDVAPGTSMLREGKMDEQYVSEVDWNPAPGKSD